MQERQKSEESRKSEVRSPKQEYSGQERRKQGYYGLLTPDF